MGVVYIDVLFFINFIMDYIVLWIVGATFRVKISSRRIIFASLIGAAYAVGMFFCDIAFFYSFAAKLAVGILMAYVAYKPKNRIEFIKYAVGLVGASVMLGGGLFMIFYLTDTGSRVGAIVKNGVVYFNVSLLWLIISALVVYIVISIYAKMTMHSRSRRFYNIEICLGLQTAAVRALVDTGNSLREPATQLPVIVVEEEGIAELLNEREDDSLYIIPFCALGNDNGVILGFKPEYVRIIDERKYIKEVIIGIYSGKLSRREDYHALINPTAL